MGTDTSKYPVESVTWKEAADFCLRLNELDEEKSHGRRYRLLTEAEWEYVCRSGTPGPIPLDIYWNQKDSSGIIACKWKTDPLYFTTPVGKYPANSMGVFDTCGNVFEWVGDYYHRDSYRQGNQYNPGGPSTGYVRVVRGWHWLAIGPSCKEFLVIEPGARSRFVGFRILMFQLPSEI